jgi:hypothetical protein
MHYLEDYLECMFDMVMTFSFVTCFFIVSVLDPLPEIMREKLTLMRENDLKIQSELTQLEDDASQFLTGYRLYQKQSSLSPTRTKIDTHRSSQTTENPTSTLDTSNPLTSDQLAAQQQKQLEYDKLVERHQQLIQSTTTKISLAAESHDIVERYYKKLENDLNKFKMELEADYSGITETLEKRAQFE